MSNLRYEDGILNIDSVNINSFSEETIDKLKTQLDLNSSTDSTVDVTESLSTKELNIIGDTSTVLSTYSIDNPEWLSVTLDNDDKIISGIKKDGTTYISKIESDSIPSTEDYVLQSDFDILSEKVEDIVDKKYRIICCDGDSLTWGHLGKDEYGIDLNQSEYNFPKILQDILGEGYKVLNFGIPGAPSPTLVANPTCFRITSDFIIPSNDTSEFFTLGMIRDMSNISSWTFGPVLSHGTMGGTNPCYICGIKGNLIYTKDSSLGYGAKFSRIKPGAETIVKSGDLVLTNEYVNYPNADHIIFIGANGGWMMKDSSGIQDEECVNEYVGQVEDILRISGDLYIVISYCNWYVTNGDNEVIPWAGEKILEEKYGLHYINLRKYLSTDVIQDGIDKGYFPNDGSYPTSVDLLRMSKGMPAVSIRALDGVHFNDIGYRLIGELVAERYKKLIKCKVLGTLK